MLVLNRYPCEAIKIGHDIEVRVFRVRNGNVRFGITAPRDVLVLRSELLEDPRRAEAPWRTVRGKSAARRFPPDSAER